MIECRQLTKAFGPNRIVNGIDFAVEEGETLVLIGASGSGKTTTLKMLNRLVEPTSGIIRIEGRDTRESAPHELRRRIGYGAQRAGLFPHWSVAENISVTARLLGWAPREIEARVEELLERVRLDSAQYRDRRVTDLSGGEQQRVSLARALMVGPRVLLLDEPFGALDPVSRDELQESLADLSGSLGLTVVFVTHDMSEALLLGDRIAFLDEGRLARIGTPSEVMHSPGSDRVADFLRAPRRQAARIESLIGDAPVRPPGGAMPRDGDAS